MNTTLTRPVCAITRPVCDTSRPIRPVPSDRDLAELHADRDANGEFDESGLAADSIESIAAKPWLIALTTGEKLAVTGYLRRCLAAIPAHSHFDRDRRETGELLDVVSKSTNCVLALDDHELAQLAGPLTWATSPVLTAVYRRVKPLYREICIAERRANPGMTYR